ncbi:MAG TPA: MarR family transcriptional regulator [Stackebrandtia sp.]|uniref:MarR family winged helix-turn-helix transcriptional regulator n=1 Tax=Stackebrandtia sp. TaxID=2023065 RepID=UPI002D3AF251|nr:MarR family transcriptional regulator [Stackebrandtia sp.]HZE40052.1 MarR family transcriptional regulator [Stackebrandtia sp.]
MRDSGEELEERVGYVLKRATAALRAELDDTLRRHGLTMAQYACLELLDQRPELSNAELARGAFVTRQSMNTVLRGLVDAGLVRRPESAPHGRARPARLTRDGRARLAAADGEVAAVERRLTAGMSPERRAALLDDLRVMARNLAAG